MVQVHGTFEPVTSAFGAFGNLTLAGALGFSRVNFWYHTPFFWRIEEAGVLIFQSSGGRTVEESIQAGKLRLLSKPIFFLDELGAQISGELPIGTTHASTGRPALRAVIYAHEEPGELRPGSVTIDTETAFILSVMLPDPGISSNEAISIEMTRFEILDSVDASLFGVRTLETPGFYHGRLQG